MHQRKPFKKAFGKSHGAVVLLLFVLSIFVLSGSASSKQDGYAALYETELIFFYEPLLDDSIDIENAKNLMERGIDAYNGGEYKEASRDFKNALHYAPNNFHLRKNLAFSFASSAFEYYSIGDYESAEYYYDMALGYYDSEVFKRGLVLSMIRLGRLDEALEALESSSEEPWAWGLLIDTYIALANKLKLEGELDGALAYYRKAADKAPEVAAATEPAISELERERRAERGFSSSEGLHFIIKFDGTADAAAAAIVTEILEEAYLSVGARLDYYPREKIGVVLYTLKDFKEASDIPAWGGAIFDGRIKLPIGGLAERTPIVEDLAYHEYTHAVIHRLANGRAPTWLNEGLAQYMEPGQAAKGADGRFANAAIVREAVEMNSRLLVNLEGSFLGLARREAEAAYAVSLSATKYLIGWVGTYAISDMLEEMGDGKSIEEAISSATSMTYESLEHGWRSSIDES